MVLLEEDDHPIGELNPFWKLGMEGVQRGRLNLFPICGHVRSLGRRSNQIQIETPENRKHENTYAT